MHSYGVSARIAIYLHKRKAWHFSFIASIVDTTLINVSESSTNPLGKSRFVLRLYFTRLTRAKCLFYKLWASHVFCPLQTMFCFLISLWRWMRQFSHLVYVSNVYSCLNKFVFLLVIFLLFPFFCVQSLNMYCLYPIQFTKVSMMQKRPAMTMRLLLLSVLPS